MQKSKNVIDIVFTVDDEFKDYLYTTIVSILTNSHKNDFLSFHIIDAGLSNQTKYDIEKLKNIKNFFVEYQRLTDEEFKDFPINPILKSKVYYYRFKIPELFPKINRALYLDTDILVMDSLRFLFDLDLGGHIVAFGPNANLEGQLQNARLGLKKQHIYFNAGVMLIDCKKWKEKNIYGQAKSVAIEMYDSLKFADQDILNIIFENNYKMFTPKYNLWPGLNLDSYTPTIEHYKIWFSHTKIEDEVIIGAIKKPTIIHFAGGAKPHTPTATKQTAKLYNRIYKIAKKMISADKGLINITKKWLYSLFVKKQTLQNFKDNK